MRREVGPVMAARIQMKFVWDVARCQELVQSLGAGVEAVVVFRAAIKINSKAFEIRGAGDFDGVILFPKCGVEG